MIRSPADGPGRWIGDLRDRLARGDLDGLGRIALEDGATRFTAEQVARILLADLADLDDPGGSWGGDVAWHKERRRQLRDELRRLRARIG